MTVAVSTKRGSMSFLENTVPPPLAVALVGTAMSLIQWWALGSPVGTAVNVAAGFPIVVIGGLIVVTGARTFWRAGTTINPVNIERASALVTAGVFSYSRNPMYVGFAIMLVGWAIGLGSPWALLGPLAFTVFTDRFQIVPEERIMLAKFGDAYRDYCQRVRRWI